jgi:hypothetical protein
LGLVLTLAVISLPLVVRNAVEICVIESALNRKGRFCYRPFFDFSLDQNRGSYRVIYVFATNYGMAKSHLHYFLNLTILAIPAILAICLQTHFSPQGVKAFKKLECSSRRSSYAQWLVCFPGADLSGGLLRRRRSRSIQYEV